MVMNRTGDPVEESKWKIDFVKFHATISIFFLLLGLSPLTRVFSLFAFFDPEAYFIPQYVPYTLSVMGGVSALMYLRGNKSKIYVAFMTMILRACIAISLFMIGYFFLTNVLMYMGNSALPEYCTFSKGILCQSSVLMSHSDKLSLSLINGFNKPIVIMHISCSKNRDQYEPCSSKRCQSYDSSKIGVELEPGASTGFSLRCNDDEGKPLRFRKGDHYTGKIIIKFHYSDESSNNPRKTVGSIWVKAA
ncbi:MAG: hypothetical protein ABIG39_04090 [Candidatus Micrarchaeota archaeon]